MELGGELLEAIDGRRRCARAHLCRHQGPEGTVLSQGSEDADAPVAELDELAVLRVIEQEALLRVERGQRFLGHPVGCAMALKSLEILERPGTAEMVTLKGTYLAEKLRALSSPNIIEARGRGLMWGLELKQNAGSLLSSLLQKGLLILADGPEGKVLSFTPPFTISEEEIDFAIQEVEQLI